MIGVIGGTGLYSMEGLEVRETRAVRTPFGDPSAEVTIGRLGPSEIAFLPRHGKGHRLLPSEINYRANIWALKSVGVRRVVGVSAVGSLVREIAPGDLAVPSQYLDWTRGRRAGTFFGEGMAAHVSTAEPTCGALGDAIERSARQGEVKIHRRVSYACVEGPRLGTRAESFFLKGAGCQLVGMTNVPEAFLAREAQLCYATIAIATDYDCWLEDPSQHATAGKVIELYGHNLAKVRAILRGVLQAGAAGADCACRSSLRHALLTDEAGLSGAQREILGFLRA